MKIKLLDCTLRDGAYIVNGKFGIEAINGIIKRLSEANIDIIECGWLKNDQYTEGSTYYHTPFDAEKIIKKNKNQEVTYVAMIDWDRYDVSQLPSCNNKSIDAIRIVFPRGKHKEAISVGKLIREKGYRVFFQIANTLGYTDAELLELVSEINDFEPEGLSIVDTFGAMFSSDLQRIISLVDHNLSKKISLGFHSHNNLQQSFSLSMEFIQLMMRSSRDIIVDASLSGMGRGAGNAPTELVASYLNRFHNMSYNIDIIMDIIDVYMAYFKNNFDWGYSTPFFLSGTYCSHVNNIAYLTQKHKTRNKDIKQILESLSPDKRLVYDYDLLEKKYVEYQKNEIADQSTYDHLRKKFEDNNVLLIAPGKSTIQNKNDVDRFILKNRPVTIGINAVVPGYCYDYLFFSNFVRFQYALEAYQEVFENSSLILTSNLMKGISEITNQNINFLFVNYNDLIKRGWVHFDNSVVMCLRMLDRLGVKKVGIAGFDGYETKQVSQNNYVSEALELSTRNENVNELNSEISEMLSDFRTNHKMDLSFITPSLFE